MSDTAGWKALTPEQLEAKVRAEHGDAAWEAVQRGLDNRDPKRGRRRVYAGAKARKRRSFSQSGRVRSSEPDWREVAQYRRLREEAGEIPRPGLPSSGAPRPPKNLPPFRKCKPDDEDDAS